MKRSSFLRSLIGVYGLTHLPKTAFTQYEKVYLKQCFVRGFSYYDGPKIIDEINKSGQLEMVREPENEFDKKAIALHFNGQKIGYLPRESNKTLSILMDTDLLPFHAEITHIEPDASDWEKIRIAVFALKAIENQEDLNKIEPYSALYTPNYYSLRSEHETLTRINQSATDEAAMDEMFDRLFDEKFNDKLIVFHELKDENSNSDLMFILYSSSSEAKSSMDLNDEKMNQYIEKYTKHFEKEAVLEKLRSQFTFGEMESNFSGLYAIDIDNLTNLDWQIENIAHKIGLQDWRFFDESLKEMILG